MTETHLIYFLLGVVEEIGEVLERALVQHGLGLVVRPGHDVADCPQCSRLNLHLPVPTILRADPRYSSVFLQVQSITINQSRTSLLGQLTVLMTAPMYLWLRSGTSLATTPLSITI